MNNIPGSAKIISDSSGLNQTFRWLDMLHLRCGEVLSQPVTGTDSYKVPQVLRKRGAPSQVNHLKASYLISVVEQLRS